MKKKTISAFKNSFNLLQTHSLPNFVQILKKWLPVDKMSHEKGHSKSRNRIYTASNTFWLFLYQILMGNLSLEMAVQKSIVS